MKKLILLAVALATLSASAVERRLHSFLGVQSLVVSNANAPLMGGGITNRATVTTNATGVAFTNMTGQLIVVGVTTNANGTYAGVTQPLIGTVPLSPLSVPVNPVINATPYTNYMGDADIVIRCFGGSGANTAMTLRFSPVFGENATTESTEQFLWGVTPNTTTPVVLRTNLPLFRMLRGATGIRCDFIASGDADASSSVTITDLDIIQNW